MLYKMVTYCPHLLTTVGVESGQVVSKLILIDNSVSNIFPMMMAAMTVVP